MIEIYHNPRCRKSREGLALVEASGREFRIIRYLDEVPTAERLGEILGLLDMSTEQLLRKNEAVWKEEFKGKNLSEEEIILAMVQNPKLIERPVVIDGRKAVLGRPPQRITEFLAN